MPETGKLIRRYGKIRIGEARRGGGVKDGTLIKRRGERLHKYRTDTTSTAEPYGDIGMKTSLLLLTALGGLTILTGCVYDDDGYRRRSVTVSTGGYYPAGEYDEYSPYYAYSGRRYYRTGGRYVYYSNSRPYYVTTVPSRARYITPVRRHRGEIRVVSRYDIDGQRNSPDWPR